VQTQTQTEKQTPSLKPNGKAKGPIKVPKAVRAKGKKPRRKAKVIRRGASKAPSVQRRRRKRKDAAFHLAQATKELEKENERLHSACLRIISIVDTVLGK
jgi:hypothetical protein